MVIALLHVAGTHEESLTGPLLFLHDTLGRSGVLHGKAMVGELGVMANGLQCDVLIILPPGVQRVSEGRGRQKEGTRVKSLRIEQSCPHFPQEVVSANSSHFLFSSILNYPRLSCISLAPSSFAHLRASLWL